MIKLKKIREKKNIFILLGLFILFILISFIFINSNIKDISSGVEDMSIIKNNSGCGGNITSTYYINEEENKVETEKEKNKIGHKLFEVENSENVGDTLYLQGN